MPKETDTSSIVPAETAQKIYEQAVKEIATSRQFKRARLDQIKENEDLYYGIAQKQIRNPYNECYPYMAGFIDNFRSAIDDDSNLLFTYQAEEDLKRAQKINTFYEMESRSVESNASWNLKHRHAKFNALMSGVAIYEYYAESDPTYKSYLNVISHYDFHSEPRGGAILENHLFLGIDSIFINKEALETGKQYNAAQVKKLTETAGGGPTEKDNDDPDSVRNNRYQALRLDPRTHNYVGQSVYKFVKWYTTYNNKRYYILFNEQAGVWVRCEYLTTMIPNNMWPIDAWHTNEDPDIFLSKAPADDARPIARMMNNFLNQEAYNRQKSNYGETHYDMDMYPNVQALVDPRPDKHVPVDTKGGARPLSSGVYKVPVPGLNGTLDFVSWLEQFTGKATGYTASAAGQSESDKKVGVFKGEIEQTQKLIGIKNKSYRDFLSRMGLRFKAGLDANLNKPVAIQMIGAKGIEWDELKPEDLKTTQPLKIQPVGGTSEIELKRIQDNEKVTALSLPDLGINPQWKARQILLLKGFTDADIKDAFSASSFALKELLSEAAEAEREIVEGKTPKLNRGADSNYMQHIIDYATDTEDLDLKTYTALMKFAMDHTDIAIENESRNIKEMIRAQMMARASQGIAEPVENAQPQQQGKLTVTSTPTPAAV